MICVVHLYSPYDVGKRYPTQRINKNINIRKDQHHLPYFSSASGAMSIVLSAFDGHKTMQSRAIAGLIDSD